MCDSLERHSKDGTLGHTWKKRFRNKWPPMTTLMHQSEITIRPYLEHEYADPHEIMAYQNFRIPDWDGTSETSWSAARSLEQDIHEGDTVSKINQNSSVKKKRRCEKVCRNILFAFLILSILVAVAAAIGLSFFLNLHQNNSLAKQDGHHHGYHIPSNITTEEEIYLSKIFCSVVNRLLIKTDFPVKNGINGCHASLQFIDNSEDLHIEMHVSPREGYTIKEKILRALSEGVLMDMMESLRKTEIQTSTTVKELSTELSTWPDINIHEQVTTTSLPTHSVSQDTVFDSTDAPASEVVSRTQSVTTMLNSSTEEQNPSIVNETFNNQNDFVDGREIEVDKSISSSYFEGATTLPPIIMPKEKLPMDNLNVEHSKTYLYERTTTTERTTNKVDDITTNLDDGTKIFDTTSTIGTLPRLAIKDSTTQDSVKNIETFSTTETSKIEIPWVLESEPVVTKLFNPVPVDITNNILNDNSRIGLPNVQPQLNRKKSPKIVESLMAGGVMKLPFKTNSNFRFLFSSDSKMKSKKQNISNGSKMEIQETRDNLIDTANKNNKSFNSQNIKYSKTEALDLFTEKPKYPKLLRTLRLPTSSTKSFLQRKAELQRSPKRTVDVTEFGTERNILKVSA